MTKTTLFIALFALTTASGAVSAQTDGDALRCEARKMRAESQYFGCLARCDRRADRNAARPEARRAASTLEDCEATCTAHYDEDLARIDGKPPCTSFDAATADPKDCEARMLRLSASSLRCQARCSRQRRHDGWEPAGCLAACDTRCGTSYDELMVNPVCGAGRIGEAEVCTIH